MRLGITGSRFFEDYDYVKEKIESVVDPKDVELFVSGSAKGIDRDGERWASENNIPIESIKPNYEKFGKGAPFIRNEEIVNQSDVMVAFPLLPVGTSHGTEHTINLAKKKGITIHIFPIDNTKDTVDV
jgi:hypothetical protein